MALQKQIIGIPLARGVNTKVDEKILPAGQFTRVENIEFDIFEKAAKRPGYDSIELTAAAPSSATGLGYVDKVETAVTGAQWIDGNGGELIMSDGKFMYGWSPDSQRWYKKSPHTFCSTKYTRVTSTAFNKNYLNIASGGGITVVVWVEIHSTTPNSATYYTVLDTETNATIIKPTALFASIDASRLKIVFTDNRFWIVAGYGSNMYVAIIDKNEPARLIVNTTVAGITFVNPKLDLVVANGRPYLVWHTGSQIKIAKLLDDGQVDSTQASKTIGAAYISATASPDGSTIYVLNSRVSGGNWILECTSFSTSTLAIIATGTLDTRSSSFSNNASDAGMYADNSGVTAYWKVNAAADDATNIIYRNTMTQSGTAGTAAIWLRRSTIVGRPFSDDLGNIYLIVLFQASAQNSYFIVRDGDGYPVVVNQFLYGVASAVVASDMANQRVERIDSKTFKAVTLYDAFVEFVSSTANGYIQNIAVIDIDLDQINMATSTSVGPNRYITSGLVYSYDGASCTENEFCLFPETLSISASGATGGSMSSGTRQITAIYEWFDYRGNLHRSAPSVPLSYSFASGNSNKATYTIKTLHHTLKRTDFGHPAVKISLYRTEAAGTVFYKLQTFASSLNPTNDTTVDSVTYTDTVADSTITSNEVLFTTGGVVEPSSFESATTCTEYGNRLFTAGHPENVLVRYSTTYQSETEPYFSDGFDIRYDKGLGGIKTVAVLDNNLAIFKTKSLALIAGQGPDNLGSNNDFGIPQQIATDVGCPFPRSVVTIPDGLFFKSEKGYYLLSRSFQVQYIGAPVERYNSLTVSSACLIPSRNEIRFTHIDGPMLTYNYLANQWQVHPGLEALSATLWGDTDYALVRPDNTVWVENRSNYKDVGTNYSLLIETGWISLAQVQGFQRIYKALILGRSEKPNKLRIKVAYDFEGTYTDYYDLDTEDFAPSNYYGQDSYYGSSSYFGSSSDNYQVQVNLNRQKCQSIRFLITEQETQTVPGSFSLSHLALLLGVKGETARLRVAQRAS